MTALAVVDAGKAELVDVNVDMIANDAGALDVAGVGFEADLTGIDATEAVLKRLALILAVGYWGVATEVSCTTGC